MWPRVRIKVARPSRRRTGRSGSFKVQTLAGGKGERPRIRSDARSANIMTLALMWADGMWGRCIHDPELLYAQDLQIRSEHGARGGRN